MLTNVREQWRGISAMRMYAVEGRGVMSVALYLAAASRVGPKPAWDRFPENIMCLPSQLWDIVPMFVSLGKALYPHMLHLNQV